MTAAVETGTVIVYQGPTGVYISEEYNDLLIPNSSNG
jgi:hypothetical protein